MVLGLGGTIAGLGSSSADHTHYLAGQLGVAQLVAAVPALAEWTQPLVVEQLAQLDSKDMDTSTWAILLQRVAALLDDEAVRGIVITHGTDTLEETAYLLHAVLAPAKPVVITCAMRPASALAPDGPQNLLDAVTLASQPGVQGVLAVCAGVVHGPQEVQKVHPYRLDAFVSGDAGPLAYVEAGRVRQLRAWPGGHRPRRDLLPALARPWPRVAIVMSHADAQAWMVASLLAAGVQGLVVAGTGNATVHRAMEATLEEARARGVRLLRTSRCALGQVVEPSADSMADLSTLSPVKARIALALDLMADAD